MTIATRLGQHEWVKHVICPVETIPNGDSDPYIFVDPDAADRAEREAVYGCRACHEPMADAFGTLCTGDPGDDD